MSTDFLIRTHLEQITSKTLTIPAKSDDPLAYQNLAVVKQLSKGKFPVYLTTSKITNQSYVMKVYSNLFEDSDLYYNNELRFTSLGHPNVLNILETNNQKAGQKNLFTRVKYVLSEYAPHGDFFSLITQHKNEIDEKLVRTYFRQLIEGLEYLHRIGIAHLDLKPENLLIGEDFNLKIADFDLSYVEGDTKIISGGTRLYRGPEFYSDKFDDSRFDAPMASDIYSAGIILFIFKTGGVYPHLENHIEGMNLTELMEKNSSKFWSKHTEFQGKSDDFFDRKFKSLFRKMTKPNPKNRASIKKIKKSKWYNGPIYTPEELKIKMKTILKC